MLNFYFSISVWTQYMSIKIYETFKNLFFLKAEYF